jgi:hypothetical protein
MAGHGRHQLARIDRVQVRLGRVEVDGDGFGTRLRRAGRPHFVDALLVELDQPLVALRLSPRASSARRTASPRSCPTDRRALSRAP